jgi:hypothetical protein
MARDIAGSLRKFTIEGQSFRVAADANVTETITQFENSMVATSGEAMRKMTKRVPMREGIVLLVNADEREDLIAFAESLDDLKISYSNAAGDEYKCEGTIEIENSETEENRLTCQVHPRDIWTPIIAS